MAKSTSTPKTATKKHLARVEREQRQIRLIMTISITAIVLAVILVGYGILQTTYLQYRKPVAQVNGETITLGYWQERVQYARLNLVNTLQQYQYYQQFGMDTSQQQQQIMMQLQVPATLGDQVLTQLIDEALIRQEAQKRGITVTDAEVNEKLQGAFNFYPNGSPTPTITPTEPSLPTLTTDQLKLYPPSPTPTEVLTATPAPTSTPDRAATATVTAQPSPTSLPQLPTATATPYTLDGYNKQFADTLKNFKSYGISEATFRSVFLNQMYRDKLQAEITKDTPHTEEQVLARHILVDNEQLAGVVYNLLKSGQDFAEIARKYSKDTGSAASGGELPWSTRDTFVTEFSVAAFSQPIGEIGQPIKTQYGYHIIQVIAREDLPVSASQYDQKKQTAFNDWLTKLNDDTKAAGKITTYNDVWQKSIPAMPTQIQQILNQQQQQ